MLATLSISLFMFTLAASSEEHDVRLPPYFKGVIPHEQVSVRFRESNRIELTCDAGGSPQPRIYWKKNGDRLPDGPLTIENGTSRANGMYQCLAESKYGIAASHFYNVQMGVLVWAEKNCATPQSLAVMEGDPVTLTPGNVTSFPPVSISWDVVFNDVRTTLAQDENTYIDIKGNVYIAHARETGSYTVKFTNSLVDMSKGCDTFSVVVTPKSQDIQPKLHYSTQSPLVVVENRPMILECFVNGRPGSNHKVHWSRIDGTALTALRYKFGPFGYRLEITNSSLTDTGNYTCSTGGGNHPIIKKTIEVNVEAAPLFKANMFPYNRNVTEGEDVDVHCSAHSIPSAKVQWFMNSQRINEEDNLPRISLSENQETLRIRSVCKDCSAGRETDLMVVQCKVSNKHGFSYASGYINVLKKTEVKVTGGPERIEKETGYEEDTFERNCTATSDPSTPVLPKWFNVTDPNHKEVLVSDSEVLFVVGGYLRFNVSKGGTKNWKHYHGVYACIANNSYSSSNVSLTIFVKNISIAAANMYRIWWILLVCFILLLLLIAFMIIYCYYNAGNSYNVNKKELQNGNDPIKEIDEKGFKIYSRQQPDFKSSQATLISTNKTVSESGGDNDPGRFTEDGSFLGVYTGDGEN